MTKEKNYNLWYKFTFVLLIVTAIFHIAGYFTNALYLAVWILWLPVIAVTAITFFDFFYFARSKSTAYAKFMSRKTIKTFMTAIVLIIFVYCIADIVYCMITLNSVDDIRQVGDAYYSVTNNELTLIDYDEYARYALAGYRILSGQTMLYSAVCLWYYDARRAA